MFSTHHPPTVQQMPWPVEEDEEEAAPYNTWVLNEQEMEFDWLVDSEGKIPSALMLGELLREAQSLSPRLSRPRPSTERCG